MSNAMTPAEAAAHLRDLSVRCDAKEVKHVVRLRVALLMGAEALEAGVPRVLTLEEIDKMLKTGLETPVYNELKNAGKNVARGRWNIISFLTVMSAKHREAYGREYRTWTHRPNPEQMAATPWEVNP